jgi:hypothetical protein
MPTFDTWKEVLVIFETVGSWSRCAPKMTWGLSLKRNAGLRHGAVGNRRRESGRAGGRRSCPPRFMESPDANSGAHWDHEPWRVRNAGFRACGFGRLSSRPFGVHRTRKSGEPAGWKACATSRFMGRQSRHIKRTRSFTWDRDSGPRARPETSIHPRDNTASSVCRRGARSISS